MASGIEVLRFQLPGHEAATLRNMNQLRSEERFCDVTIVADSLKFRGHKVILAACSPFLRDQFLLNPSSELQVSLMHSSKIVTDLLLSCYTGMLEFAVRDIVNYLTAASYLQMEHVVEKCRNALSQFIEPKISLKEDSGSSGARDVRSKACGSAGTIVVKETGRVRMRSTQTNIKLEMPLDEDLEMKVEEDEEDEDDDNYDDQDDDAVSDICIVKVESALEVGHRQKQKQQCIWLKEDEVVQQDESQVNSTVENASLEHSQQGVVKACYSFSEDIEGEGLLIIPSSFHEDREATSSSSKCQSSRGGGGDMSGIVVNFGSRPLTSGTAKDVLKVGNPLKNLKCTKCEEVFQGVEKLVFHMRAHHFIFMCPRCGKQFNHSSNLNRHMNVHRGVKSHTCVICGKCFTQKSTLHDHMNLHSGERPYRCSYCDVRFAHKPAIRRHLKEQHGKTTAENVLEASAAENGTVASAAGSGLVDPNVAEINVVVR
uniref:Zinc finger and BTB domain-containing protein 12 n=1 Tax=Geotrypetes seraphini TaxID=260995 RepID=A0A6P8NUN8_GEOSA|nr:zinc finger and BTB domain-containing protein 12 [Geotrypetes seraphini]XP_033772545.1 zinc finger and BTB domain-containing protein 12 [Geotrypetes seraphini]